MVFSPTPTPLNFHAPPTPPFCCRSGREVHCRAPEKRPSGGVFLLHLLTLLCGSYVHRPTGYPCFSRFAQGGAPVGQTGFLLRYLRRTPVAKTGRDPPAGSRRLALCLSSFPPRHRRSSTRFRHTAGHGATAPLPTVGTAVVATLRFFSAGATSVHRQEFSKLSPAAVQLP